MKVDLKQTRTLGFRTEGSGFQLSVIVLQFRGRQDSGL